MAQNNEERIRFASDEIVTKHNLDLVVELFAADYVAHAGEAKYKGTSFNNFLPAPSVDYIDTLSGQTDSCTRVKVSKIGSGVQTFMSRGRT